MGIQGTPNMGMVIFAAIIISLALVFYTIGVFAERRSGTLRPKHLAFFWTGFVFDTAGTTIMSMVAGETGGAGSPLHAITGVLALSLMLFVLLYSPCFVALVVIRQEAGSWGWVAFSILFNTALAYGVATAAYQIGRVVWG